MAIPESGIAEYRFGPSRRPSLTLFFTGVCVALALVGWAWLGQHGLFMVLVAAGISLTTLVLLVGPLYLRNWLVRNQSVTINFSQRTVTARQFCHNSSFFPRRDDCVEFSFDDIHDVHLIEGGGAVFGRGQIQAIEFRKTWYPARLHVTTDRGYFSVSNAIEGFEDLVANLRDISQERGKPKQWMARETSMALVAFFIVMGAATLATIAIWMGWI